MLCGTKQLTTTKESETIPWKSMTDTGMCASVCNPVLVGTFPNVRTEPAFQLVIIHHA